MGLFDFFNKKDKKPDDIELELTRKSTQMPKTTPAENKRYVTFRGQRMEVQSESVTTSVARRKTSEGNYYTATSILKHYILKEQQGSRINLIQADGPKPRFTPADLSCAVTILYDRLDQLTGENAFDYHMLLQVSRFVSSHPLVAQGDQYAAQGNALMAAVCYEQGSAVRNAQCCHRLMEALGQGACGKADVAMIETLFEACYSVDFVPGIISGLQYDFAHGKSLIRKYGFIPLISALCVEPGNHRLLSLYNQLFAPLACSSVDQIIGQIDSKNANDSLTSLLATLCYAAGRYDQARSYAQTACELGEYRDACIVLAMLERTKRQPDYKMVLRYLLNGLAEGVPSSLMLRSWVLRTLDEWIGGTAAYPTMSDEELELARQLAECLAGIDTHIYDKCALSYLSKYMQARELDEEEQGLLDQLCAIIKELNIHHEY